VVEEWLGFGRKIGGVYYAIGGPSSILVQNLMHRNVPALFTVIPTAFYLPRQNMSRFLLPKVAALKWFHASRDSLSYVSGGARMLL